MKFKFLFILALLPILVSCGDDEPKNKLFSYVVTEIPTDAEYSIDGTDLGISTTGDEQSITISLVGDFDSFNVSDDVSSWVTVQTSGAIKLTLSEYFGEEFDMRSGVVAFTVFKGTQSEAGRIIIHQYATTPRIPTSPVHLTFNQAEWDIFGVISPLEYKYFNKSKSLPSNFSYSETTLTGFGGIYLISDVMGNPHAYDAACPVECQADITMQIDATNLTAKCPRCGSVYDIFQNNGFPVSGVAADKGFGLKQYNVIVSGNNQTISN